MNSNTPKIACVYMPDFVLQLCARELSADFALPVALVDRNDARATVVAVDKRAAEKGVYPGLRYASAIAICPELHAICPHLQQIDYVHQRLMQYLGTFSPAVEPVSEQTGAYYLDVSGMHRLEPDLKAWAKRIQSSLLQREQLQANVVIGFTRFGTRTVACTTDSILFNSMAEEHQAASSVQLQHLNLAQKPLKELKKLGVHTIGDLRKLPAWEVRSRFAEELFDLTHKANQDDGKVYGTNPPEPYYTHTDLEYIESDLERILKIIQKQCRPLLKRLERKLLGVEKMHVRLIMDIGETYNETLETAQPTLDERTLVDLLRLRLKSLSLDYGITGLAVHIIPGHLPDPQLNLYQDIVKSENSLLAANQSLARVCAEFGPNRVLRARCQKSHLPENSYLWENFDHLRKPVLQHQDQISVVRRIFDRPNRISTPRRANLENVYGPYTICGFWWLKTKIHRSDYFVETKFGSTQWIFYDQIGRQWYEQGFVQ